jgi:GDPmannose 4,6-dehydratase
MWLMLQQEKAEDFVIATGVTNTVRSFLILAFKELNVEIEFMGEGVSEVGIIKSSANPNFAFEVGQEVIKIDPSYFRPTDVDLLIGDNTKAKTLLGWEPKYTLSMIVKEMIQADLKLIRTEKLAKSLG